MIIQENNYSDRDLKQNWNEKNNERKKVICLRRYYHWTVKKMHGGKVLDSVEEEVLTNFLGALVQNTAFILYVTVSSITQVLSTLILPSSRSRETRRSSKMLKRRQCKRPDVIIARGITAWIIKSTNDI